MNQARGRAYVIASEFGEVASIQFTQTSTLFLEVPLALRVRDKELFHSCLEHSADCRRRRSVGCIGCRDSFDRPLELARIDRRLRDDGGQFIRLHILDKNRSRLMHKLEDPKECQFGHPIRPNDELLQMLLYLQATSAQRTRPYSTETYRLGEDSLEEDLHDIRRIRKHGLYDLGFLANSGADFLE